MKYRIDQSIVDTGKSRRNWKEESNFDGRNYISQATGSQWEHEQLFESSKGRYYVVHWSQWQGSRDWAEWVTPAEAAAWLLANGHEVPARLEPAAAEVSE
jgi:hypothetical protein